MLMLIIRSVLQWLNFQMQSTYCHFWTPLSILFYMPQCQIYFAMNFFKWLVINLESFCNINFFIISLDNVARSVFSTCWKKMKRQKSLQLEQAKNSTQCWPVQNWYKLRWKLLVQTNEKSFNFFAQNKTT